MSASFLIGPGEGQPDGLGLVRKIAAGTTRGGLSLWHARIPPGMFVPPHVHTREDEATYVLDGTVDFVIGEEHLVASTGAWVLKPRGVFHAFWNAGTTSAQVIEIVAPGTLDAYFAELGALATDPGLDPESRGAAIRAHHARHGITFDDGLARGLRERYALGA